METSLHRELKERYGPGSGGRREVSFAGYRIDAVALDGELIEVQSASLAPLREKLARLLARARVRVVKPVVVARRIVRRAERNGTNLSARFSPKRGELVDVFDDLIGLAQLFPHQNLTIEVLSVVIDEVRVTRRRRPGYEVVDRGLREIEENVTLSGPADLWRLLPERLSEQAFTTRDLSLRLDRPLQQAQRVAYCLLKSGAVKVDGKSGRWRVFTPTGT